MKKIIAIISTISLMSVALPALASVTPTRPSCPISAAAGRIIVNFDPDVKLLSVGPLASGPVSVNIPAGDYKVREVSWDGYLGRESVSQSHEQWYTTVENGSGILATSGTISDLPDNAVEATVNEVVNDAGNPLHLASAGTKVYARHAYPTDASSANSVFPICVSFDPIQTGSSGSADEITVDNSNHSSVTNTVDTGANTGDNTAVGGAAGNSVSGGGSNGGNVADGGSAGGIATGDAGASSLVANAVGLNVTHVSPDCGCSGAGSTKITVKNNNNARVGNAVSTGANTGKNAAVGGSAGNSVSGLSHGGGSNGGNSATGGDSGSIVTGNAGAASSVTNLVNKNFTKIH